MVKAYSILVWICFFLSLALTAFTLYLVFSKSSLIKCLDKDLKEIACSSVFNTGRKVGLVASSVVGLLFQLCKSISAHYLSNQIHLNSPLPDICVIIKRYVQQLEDEQAYKNDFGLNKKSHAKSNTSYSPFQSIESHRGLLNHKK